MALQANESLLNHNVVQLSCERFSLTFPPSKELQSQSVNQISFQLKVTWNAIVVMPLQHIHAFYTDDWKQKNEAEAFHAAKVSFMHFLIESKAKNLFQALDLESFSCYATRAYQKFMRTFPASSAVISPRNKSFTQD